MMPTKSPIKQNGHEISAERVNKGRNSEAILRRAARQDEDLSSAVEAHLRIVSEANGVLASHKDVIYEGPVTRTTIAETVAILKTTSRKYRLTSVGTLVNHVVKALKKQSVQ
jgi:hypothetical protein